MTTRKKPSGSTTITNSTFTVEAFKPTAEHLAVASLLAEACRENAKAIQRVSKMLQGPEDHRAAINIHG